MSFKPVVTVYDSKAEACVGLYVVASLAVGMRMFGDTLAQDNMMATHPEDFTLIQVGQFDEESGDLLGGDWNVVIEAAELVRRKSKPSENGELPGQVPLSVPESVEAARDRVESERWS